MVGFNRRFDPGFAQIKQRVTADEIGELRQLTIISRDPAPAAANYLVGSGGIFRDMTIHDFDMARFMLGEFVSVSAAGAAWNADIAEIDDLDTAVVVLTTADGATATILNSRQCAAGYDQRLEAFGPKGALEAHNQHSTAVRFAGAVGTGIAAPYLPFFLERYAAAYRAELDHFIAAIAEGVAPSPSILDGRAALQLADAADTSARTSAVVGLS